MKSPEQISVVIIDDHLMVAETVAAAFAATDDILVAAIAVSGADGLKAVAAHQPDVCLLDQRLPDGLGTDLLPALLEASPLTKVLVVTGSDSADVLHRAVVGGTAGFIAKGQRVSTLIDAVRRAAAGGVALTAEDLRRLVPGSAHAQARLGDDLTQREREVLALLAEGRSTQVVGERLFISPTTARNHIQSILGKLGAHSKLEAVTIGLREGLVSPP